MAQTSPNTTEHWKHTCFCSTILFFAFGSSPDKRGDVILLCKCRIHFILVVCFLAHCSRELVRVNIEPLKRRRHNGILIVSLNSNLIKIIQEPTRSASETMCFWFSKFWIQRNVGNVSLHIKKYYEYGWCVCVCGIHMKF